MTFYFLIRLLRLWIFLFIDLDWEARSDVLLFFFNLKSRIVRACEPIRPRGLAWTVCTSLTCNSQSKLLSLDFPENETSSTLGRKIKFDFQHFEIMPPFNYSQEYGCLVYSRVYSSWRIWDWKRWYLEVCLDCHSLL